MKLIYIVILHILALSTGTYASERQLRAKASRRSNRPSTSPTSTPTANQSTRRRPKASKRTRRPIASRSSTPTRNPSTYPSTSPSESPSNSPFAYSRNETAKLTAHDGAMSDNFGFSSSISGNIAIVGAPYGDGHDSNSGFVVVIEKDELTGYWNQTAKLTASDGAEYDYFGISVSISDNIAIIGAWGDDDKADGSGSAYVFEKDKSTGHWNQTAKLTASDGAKFDEFGRGVSISGNVVIVGACFDDDNGFGTGSAYVFEKDESTGDWNEVSKLTASDASDSDNFGCGVSISGNTAIIGAKGDDENGRISGSVYVFEKNDSTGRWTETAKLLASGGTSYDEFGRSVSISGNIAIIGEAHDDDDIEGPSSAYIFEKDASTGHWNETAILIASDIADYDFFGRSVSISDNIAVVGAYGDDDKGDRSGSAYLFEKDDSTGNWKETAKLTASDGAPDDEFGFSVSIFGNTVIVGSIRDDDNDTDSGSIYAFEIASSTRG